jgi:hypothetical protein
LIFSCGNAVLGQISGISGSGAFWHHFWLSQGTIVVSMNTFGFFLIQLENCWWHWSMRAS